MAEKFYARVQIKVYLVEDPSIWRIFRVSARCSLDRLHRVIQAAMGWDNCHCYQFRVAVGGKFIGDCFDPLLGGMPSPFKQADEVLLWDVIKDLEAELYYLYDLGDRWLHKLEILECNEYQEEARPWCEDGAKACPPENVGGVDQWKAELKILHAGVGAKYIETCDWLRLTDWPKGTNKLDPDYFSVDDANKRMRYS